MLDELLAVFSRLTPAQLSAEQQSVVYVVVCDIFFGQAGNGGATSTAATTRNEFVSAVCERLRQIGGVSDANSATVAIPSNADANTFTFLCTCLVRQAAADAAVAVQYYDDVAQPMLLAEGSTRFEHVVFATLGQICLLYTSPSPRDRG